MHAHGEAVSRFLKYYTSIPVPTHAAPLAVPILLPLLTHNHVNSPLVPLHSLSNVRTRNR